MSFHCAGDSNMARTCPFVILSPSSVNMISIFPFTLEIRFAGGFMVVISTVAGTISGYLINPETEITSKRKTKKMVIPHLNIHVGR